MDSPPSPLAGLTSGDAAERLERFGPNDPVPIVRLPWIAEIGLLLKGPLNLILLFAAAVSAFLGERTDAILITVMVAGSIGLNFVQTYRSRRAADTLRSTLAPTATVLQDGAFREILRADVFAFLGAVTATYLLLVELVKRRVLPRVGVHHAPARKRGTGRVRPRAGLAPRSRSGSPAESTQI